MGLSQFFSRFTGGGPQVVDVWRRFDRLHETTSGTMSNFYKVREKQTGHIYGLKILDPKKVAPVEARYRGLRKPNEGTVGSLIKGPNIVRTLEWGVTPDGRPFVLQEFVEGTLLHTLLSTRRPLPPATRLDLVRQGATAVGDVHRAGFVHRDICPRNFLLEPGGRLVLFDFGLSVPDKPEFLRPGNRIGTPNYMAPEVVRRRQGDKGLDVFSFGVTAYEICTLELPWPRGSTGKAALTHDSPPCDIREYWPDIPPKLAESIMACLAPESAGRPASMDAFLQRISRVVA
ncbi:MAG: serine/threonine protein kinase [Planctomycetia bacterium]|nr:serine/threonine protein kinase [Planctomycetia bacterium]